MQTPALIFCERSGRWAAAWRSVFPGSVGREPPAVDVRVLETRSVAELRETWTANPNSFALVELSVQRDDVFKLLLDRLRGPASGGLVVLLGRELAGYRGLASELGAVSVVDSARGLVPVRGVLQRWLATLEPPGLALRERIWARLPWRPAGAPADGP